MNPADRNAAVSRPEDNLSSTESGSGYAILTATTRKILEEKDISKTLLTVCQEACHILGAERALVVRVQEDGKESARTILASHNVPLDFIKSLEASQSRSFIHEVLE